MFTSVDRFTVVYRFLLRNTSFPYQITLKRNSSLPLAFHVLHNITTQCFHTTSLSLCGSCSSSTWEISQTYRGVELSCTKSNLYECNFSWNISSSQRANTKAVHNRVMRYSSTLPGLQANTRTPCVFFLLKKIIKKIKK